MAALLCYLLSYISYLIPFPGIRNTSTWYSSALKAAGLMLRIDPGATTIVLMREKDTSKLVALESEKSRGFKTE